MLFDCLPSEPALTVKFIPMHYKPQDDNMNHSGVGGSIYSMIALVSWFTTTFLNIGMGEIQTAVSVLGGLVAMVSGVISIYKNMKKP